MSYYPDEIIEEVRLSNDLVEVVSEYIRLEKKGGGYFGLCPFHKEKTPSFHVEPVRQFYYCFGCNQGGNVFHFIMNIENVSFPDAVKMLADRAGIVLPEPDDKEEQQKIRLRKKILEANKAAARFYFSCLASEKGKKALKYLYDRGLSNRIIKRFGLGYAPDEWSILSDYLLKEGFDEYVIIQSGLAIKGRSGKLIDRFRGRVIFPIFDIRGNVVAFGGRVLDDSLPKYINSPETPCYSKGRELFGLHLAKKSSEKKLLIVEGYMDVISLHQAGIDFAVASLGTALTSMQGRLLKKYADEVILGYDSDNAGQKATERGIEVLNRIGCRVKVLQVPDGKDPDEFIRKNGPEKFKMLIDRAISLLEYKINVLKNTYPPDNEEGRLNFLNGVADLLTEVENFMEREIIIRKISGTYGISEDALHAEVDRRLKQKQRKEKTTEFYSARKELTGPAKTPQLHKNENIRVRYEKMLLALLSRENRLYHMAAERYPASDYSDGELREMAGILYEKLKNGEDFVLEQYISRLASEKASSLIHISETFCNFDEPEKALEDILEKLEILKLEEEKKDILMRLKNITNMEERKRLQEQLQAIIRKIANKW
ncbi:DNA primase DnaG [Thermoclostridium stercorarium subsp. stercorarium DSM 8532]|uniref:DNA primase n=2 Tax=Thermoclostridium stercorarium TaxID=1510 RepID=L7VNL5_THES1|nr:DNA primase [Thermoclostridium stercorarium]AGC68367.1 DNA primase DnaG [Thermoclostridium stercorarium subsp. stercorarium DSM 8532]AGI39390.1 DNA primase [Thermoclostridium stercorarium subsp. stercorarium DSM 8532]ANW98707.1 DNA primase [Thermoclostridium stercorarium subsp. thermolacticum DSM 2910]